MATGKWHSMVVIRITRCFFVCFGVYSLGRGELGDSLGALRHGVLGQLSWKDEADSSLDLPGGDCGLLVVASQLSGLSGNFLEDVINEGVQDGHGLRADSSVWVHLHNLPCLSTNISVFRL
jgi:hypothetical protein